MKTSTMANIMLFITCNILLTDYYFC